MFLELATELDEFLLENVFDMFCTGIASLYTADLVYLDRQGSHTVFDLLRQLLNAGTLVVEQRALPGEFGKRRERPLSLHHLKVHCTGLFYEVAFDGCDFLGFESFGACEVGLGSELVA